MKKQLLVLILNQVYKLKEGVKAMRTEIAETKKVVDEARAEFTLSLANIAQDELVQSKRIDALLAQVEQSGSLTPEEKQALVDIAASAKAMATATKERADAIVDEPNPPVVEPAPVVNG